jgi:hypothetical protein
LGCVGCNREDHRAVLGAGLRFQGRAILALLAVHDMFSYGFA